MFSLDPYTVLALHEARLRDAERDRRHGTTPIRRERHAGAAVYRWILARTRSRPFGAEPDAVASPCA